MREPSGLPIVMIAIFDGFEVSCRFKDTEEMERWLFEKRLTIVSVQEFDIWIIVVAAIEEIAKKYVEVEE